VDTVDLTLPTVLVFGNEATGLSPEYRALCDTAVRIPMHAEADSINVACAAAILLYEVDRQRRAERRMGPRPWSRPRRDRGLRIDREDGTTARRP
jgi:tRNA(Leu) C34 or U34 (ribose-2'-O)-methylase TrmL